jgi:hypothetical protein
MTNILSKDGNTSALEQHPLLRNAYQTEKVARGMM